MSREIKNNEKLYRITTSMTFITNISKKGLAIRISLRLIAKYVRNLDYKILYIDDNFIEENFEKIVKDEKNKAYKEHLELNKNKILNQIKYKLLIKCKGNINISNNRSKMEKDKKFFFYSDKKTYNKSAYNYCIEILDSEENIGLSYTVNSEETIKNIKKEKQKTKLKQKSINEKQSFILYDKLYILINEYFKIAQISSDENIENHMEEMEDILEYLYSLDFKCTKEYEKFTCNEIHEIKIKEIENGFKVTEGCYVEKINNKIIKGIIIAKLKIDKIEETYFYYDTNFFLGMQINDKYAISKIKIGESIKIKTENDEYYLEENKDNLFFIKDKEIYAIEKDRYRYSANLRTEEIRINLDSKLIIIDVKEIKIRYESKLRIFIIKHYDQDEITYEGSETYLKVINNQNLEKANLENGELKFFKSRESDIILYIGKYSYLNPSKGKSKINDNLEYSKIKENLKMEKIQDIHLFIIFKNQYREQHIKNIRDLENILIYGIERSIGINKTNLRLDNLYRNKDTFYKLNEKESIVYKDKAEKIKRILIESNTNMEELVVKAIKEIKHDICANDLGIVLGDRSAKIRSILKFIKLITLSNKKLEIESTVENVINTLDDIKMERLINKI